MSRARSLIAALVGFASTACVAHDATTSVPSVPIDAPAVEAEEFDPFDPPSFDHPTPEQLQGTSLRAFRTLMRMAEGGDLPALAILNSHYAQYEISSVARADLAELFGARRYAAAAANLADSVDAMCMNLGWAAHVSLCELFPEAAREFATPEEAADYWIAYVKTTRDDR